LPELLPKVKIEQVTDRREGPRLVAERVTPVHTMTSLKHLLNSDEEVDARWDRAKKHAYEEYPFR